MAQRVFAKNIPGIQQTEVAFVHHIGQKLRVHKNHWKSTNKHGITSCVAKSAWIVSSRSQNGYVHGKIIDFSVICSASHEADHADCGRVVQCFLFWQMSEGAAPQKGLLLVAWELTLFHPASWCFGEAMSLLLMWCESRWMAMVSLAEMVPRDGPTSVVLKIKPFNIPRLSGCCSDFLSSYLSEILLFHNRDTYEPTSIIRWDRYLSWLNCCFWFHRFVMFHPLLVGFGSSMCCFWTHHTYRWH